MWLIIVFIINVILKKFTMLLKILFYVHLSNLIKNKFLGIKLEPFLIKKMHPETRRT